MACFGVRVSKDVAAVDMRNPIPFCEGVEDDSGIDQSGNEGAKEENQNCIADWPDKSESSKEENVDKKPGHG
jgi:hypothetical protein